MVKKILIIDDDRDMLEMLDIVFQMSNLDVVLSDKGMTGDEIRVIHPDLILLDVQIRGYIKTGDEICKEIKSHPDLSSIPVFLLSAEEGLRLKAIECKADGYFSKPFEILKLRAIINKKLG